MFICLHEYVSCNQTCQYSQKKQDYSFFSTFGHLV
uniref:Uncharacterized protein n=1 Tax=Anguilla anguilla TaxID=7936 RepID=A0A0E9VED7_ANGAN